MDPRQNGVRSMSLPTIGSTSMIDLDLLVIQLANGLVIGMGYTLVAIGLTMVFGILGVLNFAHGEFFMLGAFVAYVFGELMGWPYVVSSVVAIVLVMAISFLFELISVRPFMERDPEMTLLSTFAASLILMNLVEVIWGNTPLPLNTPFSKPLDLLFLVLTAQRILILLVGAVGVILLGLFLKFTKMGKVIRATAQNKKASALVGINIKKVYRLTFAAGTGLAAIAGVLIAPLSNLYASMGQGMVLKGFVVVILGGLASVPGAILGGLTLGITEAIAAGYVSSAWKDVIGFSILIIILLLRPQGLMGRREA
ncbi:MAG TPA: branched-chain amino acid ABC transporter permease [Thermodesulfobacteriota bacterium]|nr:branched-chain amino acid ABC transporter permease [Thermodesulfobacteriota bacterium]